MTARRGGAPPKRVSPRLGTEGQHNTASTRSNGHSTRSHRGVDGYAAPDVTDRAEVELLAQAAAMGYRLSVQCTRCRQWLVAADSVHHHMGPVCRQRAGVV